MPPACLGSFRGEGVCLVRLVEAVCVAGITPVSSLCRSYRAPATFNKAMVKGFVVFASLGLQWIRSQPAAGAATSSVEVGLLGRCRGNPWDVSRQVVLPLAYPDSHPHDTSPRNWQSLMGKHGASAGSFPRRSLFASVEVLGLLYS
jgi:hypothetical protein